jgi:23S rRNA pseudouridine1911/1915/1917 synthase
VLATIRIPINAQITTRDLVNFDMTDTKHFEDCDSYSLVVSPDDAGERLDKYIAKHIDILSRNRGEKLIELGYVQFNGANLTDRGFRVKSSQEFAVHIPPAEPDIVTPQNIPLHIYYEDDDLLVVEKPAGMVMHPAAGNYENTLVNALLYHCDGKLSGIGGVCRLGLVHRLDKDTSGVVVCAKNDAAHQGLAIQFSERTINRTYKAMVWGTPQPLKGSYEGNIGRHRMDRKKLAVVGNRGKYALTHYKVEKLYNKKVSLVECRLATGRTHQIRVHFAHNKHPLIGDPLYGKRLSQIPTSTPDYVRHFPRQALHAVSLGFTHPITGDELFFKSDLPEDFIKLQESAENF